jgi:hydrogenase maturation protein HypF
MNEPLVMTSANVSDEPILFDDAAPELPGLCDAILSHDRPILSFADDSVTMVFNKEPYFIRRSRGYVPLPIQLPFRSRKTVLALGPMLKTTFAFVAGDRAFIGPHIGDTESNTALAAEKRAADHFMKLFSLRPYAVAIDKHPGYPNRLLAGEFPGARIVEVQHHKAHVASVLAENGETGPVVGIALDGTGYGDDGTVWGGEFFVGGLAGMERAGHLRSIFLPGGDAAAREPWRTALSLLVAVGDDRGARRLAARFGRKGRQVLEAVRERRGGVMTTSGGHACRPRPSGPGPGKVPTRMRWPGRAACSCWTCCSPWRRCGPTIAPGRSGPWPSTGPWPTPCSTCRWPSGARRKRGRRP